MHLFMGSNAKKMHQKTNRKKRCIKKRIEKKDASKNVG